MEFFLVLLGQSEVVTLRERTRDHDATRFELDSALQKVFFGFLFVCNDMSSLCWLAC